MVIDIITVILLAMALWKGYSRGFIVAIFSFLAILIGLAAAIKLSVIVTGWLSSSTNISKDWLPVISFAAVMIPISLTLPLKIQFPELFPGLAVPMVFFPAMAWYTIKPLFTQTNNH